MNLNNNKKTRTKVSVLIKGQNVLNIKVTFEIMGYFMRYVNLPIFDILESYWKDLDTQKYFRKSLFIYIKIYFHYLISLKMYARIMLSLMKVLVDNILNKE